MRLDTSSGFSVLIHDLPQRVPYTFVAYAHSTYSGTFDNSRSVANVTALNSPQLAVDVPGATATTPFALAGWAIDLSAGSSTGVSTIHVWAYPAAGGSPVFVGVAGYGGARPDVGAAFGPQFTSSGYYLTIGSLPPGVWDLAIFPYSTLNDTFFPATVHRISVSSP